MSDTTANLHRKIDSAGDLQSVVRTMKAMAASSIVQYEKAVRSLDDYYWTVQLGLAACFRQAELSAAATPTQQKELGAIGAVVFGSDQGLVGQFNDVMADFVVTTLAQLPGKKKVWAVGERIRSRLAETDLVAGKNFTLPNSISAIAPLVGQILIEMETQREQGEIAQVYLFYNRPMSGS
ncbi:MAG: F0F1 ATP synthase subunit gamma, partial [Burkholderiaceae bacterium]